ncbi:hypothetical protein AX774_g529 [Zancudomyces culisetae]|uniref:Uncharacterized protein n=1 Tax=Zancudomyces culisetae TaxID=1213189 RepID=A0A1R1PY88_ZANCU|nr:hypothetical protein AX774_g529 [Zancudomyces culisetae]|eukprot:OMH85912.1 hypothetical protein AX774_g529 [Zancudomyces culisetae]
MKNDEVSVSRIEATQETMDFFTYLSAEPLFSNNNTLSEILELFVPPGRSSPDIPNTPLPLYESPPPSYTNLMQLNCSDHNSECNSESCTIMQRLNGLCEQVVINEPPESFDDEIPFMSTSFNYSCRSINTVKNKPSDASMRSFNSRKAFENQFCVIESLSTEIQLQLLLYEMLCSRKS